jgi:SH3 domain-containing YSC84-like protein 1
VFGLAAICFASTLAAGTKMDAIRRIDELANALKEIMAAPDRGLPNEIFERAVCVGVIPGMKRAGFIFGGKYGKGVLTWRTRHG